VKLKKLFLRQRFGSFEDLAGALIDANPNRFQAVPESDYIKGIDF